MARDQGCDVRVAQIPMGHVARALEVDEARGAMKAVVDGETDLVLGAAVLDLEGGEVASLLQVAMMGSHHTQRCGMRCCLIQPWQSRSITSSRPWPDPQVAGFARGPVAGS